MALAQPDGFRRDLVQLVVTADSDSSMGLVLEPRVLAVEMAEASWRRLAGTTRRIYRLDGTTFAWTTKDLQAPQGQREYASGRLPNRNPRRAHWR